MSGKLAAGEKFVGEFYVRVSFTATPGDHRTNEADIRDALRLGIPALQPAHVIVKRLKKD